MLLGAALLLGPWSCAWHVSVASTPPGAAVRLDEQVVGYTPLDLRVPWGPGTGDVVSASVPGHRPLQVSVRQQTRLLRVGWQALWHPLVALGVRPPRDELLFVLVPEHGPSGTWSAEDVP